MTDCPAAWRLPTSRSPGCCSGWEPNRHVHKIWSLRLPFRILSWCRDCWQRGPTPMHLEGRMAPPPLPSLSRRPFARMPGCRLQSTWSREWSLLISCISATSLNTHYLIPIILCFVIHCCLKSILREGSINIFLMNEIFKWTVYACTLYSTQSETFSGAQPVLLNSVLYDGAAHCVGDLVH